jgi:hypothetical protein
MKRTRSDTPICVASVELRRRAHEHLLILMGALRAHAEHDAGALEPMAGPQLGRRNGLRGNRAAVAVVDDDEALGVEVERLADLVARGRGAGDQHVGAAGGGGDDRAHRVGRHEAEGPDAHERRVVQRDHRRQPRPQRRRAGETVEHLRPGAPRRARVGDLLRQRAPHPLPVLAAQALHVGEIAETDLAQERGARGRRYDGLAKLGELLGERRDESAQVGLRSA